MDVLEKTVLKMFHLKHFGKVIKNELLRIYYEKIY